MEKPCCVSIMTKERNDPFFCFNLFYRRSISQKATDINQWRWGLPIFCRRFSIIILHQYFPCQKPTTIPPYIVLLFISQRLHRAFLGCLAGGITAKHQAHKRRNAKSNQCGRNRESESPTLGHKAAQNKRG